VGDLFVRELAVGVTDYGIELGKFPTAKFHAPSFTDDYLGKLDPGSWQLP